MRCRSLVFVMLSVAALAACSSAAQGGRQVTNQNELTIEQIRDSGARDALEAVERLRPLWLRTRSQSSVNAPNTILVYVNTVRLGGLDALRGYPLDAVTKISFLTASEATNRLPGAGSSVVDGAIVISTRQQ